MSAKQKTLSTDRLLSVSAILISFITLLIFIYQTNLVRKQSHLSVLPYLLVELSIDYRTKIAELKLFNCGVGPALIESMHIIYEGERREMDFQEFFNKEFSEIDTMQVVFTGSVFRGLGIPSNADRLVLRVGGTRGDLDAFNAFYEKIQANGFDFEIIYKSIYDDRWLVTAKNEVPKKLD